MTNWVKYFSAALIEGQRLLLNGIYLFQIFYLLYLRTNTFSMPEKGEKGHKRT